MLLIQNIENIGGKRLMQNYEIGEIVIHKLSGRRAIVTAVCSDGIIVCRCCDENGVYNTYNFCKEEIYSENPSQENPVGFAASHSKKENL